MKATRICVVSQAGARFFDRPAPGKGLQLVSELPNPQAKLKDSDAQADQGGRRSTPSHAVHDTVEPKESPADRASANFARELASRLGAERAEGVYSRLIIVAAPKMLGLLRKNLDAPTEATVVGTVDKNLSAAKPDAIAEQTEHLG